MVEREWISVALRSPSQISGDWVAKWLARWGWTGKVERNVLHSAGATHYVLIKRLAKDHGDIGKTIRIGWRGEMARQKKPSVPKIVDDRGN